MIATININHFSSELSDGNRNYTYFKIQYQVLLFFGQQVKIILILVFTHTPMCVSTYTQYFPESCEQISQTNYLVGFEPTTIALLEQCLTN